MHTLHISGDTFTLVLVVNDRIQMAREFTVTTNHQAVINNLITAYGDIQITREPVLEEAL